MTREEFISMMGYSDNSPLRNEDSLDIRTGDNGIIDMTNTGIPLMANNRYLPPYSGHHQFEPNSIVTEHPALTVKGREGRAGSIGLPDSTHLMQHERLQDGTWIAFPKIFQDENGEWKNFEEINERDGWWENYQYALKRNEVYGPFENESHAASFAVDGTWKNPTMTPQGEYNQEGFVPYPPENSDQIQQPGEAKYGGSLPKFQDINSEVKPIDYSQYKYIPQEHFTMPTGDFTYKTRDWVDETDSWGEYYDKTGTYNPDWFVKGFDPYEYYNPDNEEGSGRTWDDFKTSGYNFNPYMFKNEYGNTNMEHPLVWDEDRLKSENRARFNQSLINKIYDENGNVRPEYQQQIGSQRYLRPFGTNPDDAPNNAITEGRWASEWFEGSESGWGDEGITPGGNMGYDEDSDKFRTYISPEEGEKYGSFKNLTEKELKKLYKTYKNSPGFGKMSKREFIERYKSGDVFHPQIKSVEQENYFKQIFESKVNPFKKEDFQLQKDFFTEGINSDLYREKLINAGYENADDIIAKREEHLASASFNYDDTADHYNTEDVTFKGGPGSSMAKDRDDPAYPVHTNRIFRIQDKISLLSDLYKKEGMDFSMDTAFNPSNLYTPFGDETAPSGSFYSGDEDDALFWSEYGRGFPAGKYLGDNILFGESGSRAYTGQHGDHSGDIMLSPRQSQQLNIDLGGDGSTEQLKSSLDDTSAHELGHMMGSTGAKSAQDFALNETDINTIYELMDASGIDRSTLNDHDASPYERKSDLDALRWKMYNAIGYDYRTTPMTNEILQQYKQYLNENPHPSLTDDRNFKFFNDESLVDFNNRVADVNTGMPEGMSRYGKELPRFQKKGEFDWEIATERSIYPDGEWNWYNPADSWRYLTNENETVPIPPPPPEDPESAKNKSYIPLSWDEYKIEKPLATIEQFRKYIRNPKYKDWRMNIFSPYTNRTKKGWANKEYYRGLDEKGVGEVQEWLLEQGYDIKKDNGWGDQTYNALNNYLLDNKLLNKEITTNSLLTDDLLINQQYIESDGKPKAGSNKGALGLVQAMPDAWNDAIRKGILPENADRTNIHHSLLFQRYYMNSLMNAEFVTDATSDNEKLARALSAYNWGRGNTPTFFKNINYVATNETIKDKEGNVIESGFRNKLDENGNPILVPEAERRDPFDMDSWMTILDSSKDDTRWTIPQETVDYINLIMFPEQYIKDHGKKKYESRIKSTKKFEDYKKKAKKFYSYKEGGSVNRTKQLIRTYKLGGELSGLATKHLEEIGIIPEYKEGGTTYNINDEETLLGIAKEYNTTEKDINKYNNLIDTEPLYKGQVINIPEPIAKTPLEIKKEAHKLGDYGIFKNMPLDTQIKLYSSYVNGNYMMFSEKLGKKLYDKLNRVYYDKARVLNMSVLDYMKSILS